MNTSYDNIYTFIARLSIFVYIYIIPIWYLICRHVLIHIFLFYFVDLYLNLPEKNITRIVYSLSLRHIFFIFNDSENSLNRLSTMLFLFFGIDQNMKKNIGDVLKGYNRLFIIHKCIIYFYGIIVNNTVIPIYMKDGKSHQRLSTHRF